MVEPLPIQGLTGAEQKAPADSRGTAPSSGAGPAFQALLEKLENQAQKLLESSEGELAPETLAGAAREARASLEGAMDLKDQLLEAFRAQRHADSGADAPGESGRPNQEA